MGFRVLGFRVIGLEAYRLRFIMKEGLGFRVRGLWVEV